MKSCGVWKCIFNFMIYHNSNSKNSKTWKNILLHYIIPGMFLELSGTVKMYFSRKLENRKWVLPTTHSYSYVHNCVNEWLGEPALVFQLSRRGILRNFITNLDIKNFWNQCIETSMYYWDYKITPGTIHNLNQSKYE